MYFDFTVPIPSDHVVRIRKDDIIYIYYEYDRKYNRDRGYNSAKRACMKITGSPIAPVRTLGSMVPGNWEALFRS
jgi:hypothetical protein